MEWFLSRAEAKAIIEVWRRHETRFAGSSLGYLDAGRVRREA